MADDSDLTTTSHQNSPNGAPTSALTTVPQKPRTMEDEREMQLAVLLVLEGFSTCTDRLYGPAGNDPPLLSAVLAVCHGGECVLTVTSIG